jgi:nitroimidazol reductase NimA-like FMN-containing flavoprotein (pyridoxamine 5'-phosphate oxidase superfamily)
MQYQKDSKSTIRRGAKKASYDKQIIHRILDENEVCTIAFTIDGVNYSQPINYGRFANKIYLHGAIKNRMTSQLIKDKSVCLSVFELTAMKFTRSAFSHSVNFKSAVIFGDVKELTSKEDKLFGLKAIINHFTPNRWEYCREPNDKELLQTKVLEITIKNASAKVIGTPPALDEDDKQTDFWTGIIPVKKTYENPKTVDSLRDDIKIPQHIFDFVKVKNSSENNNKNND